jgi:uncharacterized lipoprotein YbaY
MVFRAGDDRMLVKRIVTLLLLVLATMLTGCGGAHEAALTGVIGHPHSMTLPVGTVMTIQLIDRTVGGEAGKVIAEQVTQGRVIGIPTPFIVVYDQGKINADHVYFLAVRIEDSAGKLRGKRSSGDHAGKPHQGHRYIRGACGWVTMIQAD